ncbi:MAG TPA: hypothetical protein GX731_06055, partial [Clostridiales bacterium]|nr:hypothetical protein [Clostridiales bacterium]
LEDASDQTTLDDMTKRIAYNASTAYSKIRLESAIMPFHDYMNSLYIQYHRNGIEIISGQYEETAWSIPLKVGGEMVHEVRRVVHI